MAPTPVKTQTDAYKKAAQVVVQVNRRVLERLKDK